jgi:predicted RNase H-like HicB family nuclease
MFFPINTSTMREPPTCWITFPDFPYLVACGATEDEAIEAAGAALDDTITGLIEAGAPIPVPSRTVGQGIELDEETSTLLAAYMAG